MRITTVAIAFIVALVLTPCIAAAQGAGANTAPPRAVCRR